jgi:hypothetical protein
MPERHVHTTGVSQEKLKPFPSPRVFRRMATFLQDLRYGLRSLGRAPGFAAIAVAVLALGIGVNAAVFSLANAFFLRPLPVSDPDSFVRVYSNRFSNTGHATYTELRDRNSTLTDLAGFQLRSFGLRIDAENEHTFGEIVTGNYFRTIGTSAARGRLLVPSDDAPGAPRWSCSPTCSGCAASAALMTLSAGRSP